MNKKLRTTVLILAVMLAGTTIFAGGIQETDELSPASEVKEVSSIADAALALGVSENELKEALGDPNQGIPDFEAAAEQLGVSADKLEELMKQVGTGMAESVEVAPYTLTLNGIDFEVTYEVFTWDELPGDVEYERQKIVSLAAEDGSTHYYEAVYVSTGNLNWYQAAYLAQDAGGYLACPTTEEENDLIFSLVNDKKYFWAFDEEGAHYGISIGPFLGGYQPDGSPEPDGGWSWISGDEWDYTNWAVNLDDGIIDKDPRDNTQPNDSGDGQPIMGFGELNEPVPTWGDYMEAVGTYGLTRSPGSSFGFIIEYESNPM